MPKGKTGLSLRRGLFVCLAGSLNFAVHSAEHQLAQTSNAPKVAAASSEGELAIKRFTVAPGLKVDLFAAEPHLANPVAFCFDEKGRCYVCETFRMAAGVSDIRGIMDWLDEELAARTVDDRLFYMKRRLGEKVKEYTAESERVKLLEDRDGDGKVDHSTVFAEGFNQILDGVGAGVLTRKGNVWFTCIPDLWLLRDTNGDGVADFRMSLQRGYGVRIGFLGHDLHGLRFGPDGKLYFTVGDRGANVYTEGHQVGTPDTGCVLRCNSDGSELEVFASGLRNPQELAFDQYGNLWTGDNNSDSGDKARWVYLVEGGDSGWRVGYQFMEKPYSRGPFNAEKLWYPQFDGQAAYIVPPIANISSGPSGVTYNPGTGMPEKYAEHFFLADFHGDAGSCVHSFALKPKGASFELVDATLLVKGLLATDVEFGPAGGVYVSDWVQGWNKTGKGRIYRFHDPAIDKSQAVLETKRLLSEGMERRSLKELALLLANRDMRVRQEAQFALAEKGFDGIKTLADVTRKSADRLARLHAIWGLGQIQNSRFKIQSSTAAISEALRPLPALLEDADSEVRAQAARVLGDARCAAAYDGLVRLLRDGEARVRFFAALSLGKLGRKEAVPAILAMLRENSDKDPFLRHAGVLGLTWIRDMDSLLIAAKDGSVAVRMASLLAMRRLARPEIAQFLNDAEPKLVLEAARAINDEPIYGANGELAALIAREGLEEPLLRRVLNANLRQGTVESATALARFAARSSAPEAMRADALEQLGDWPRPSGRDRVVGLWRPIVAKRDGKIPADALQPVLAEVLRGSPDSVRVAAARTAAQLIMKESAPLLYELVSNSTLAGEVRVEAVRSLAALDGERLPDALNLARSDSNEVLRKEGIRLAAKLKPSGVEGQLATALDSGSLSEKQNALATLGTLNDVSADNILSQWLDKLLAGQASKELKLDILEAASKRSASAIKTRLEKYEAARAKDDSLIGYREALFGGDPAAGRKIFFERAEAACMRCHKVQGEGGDVGPDLTGIGTRQKREYILESILFP
ncbi:MAG: PVC-type heme-binding CxxCH protein, partial [Verrucomicrobiota bacterium]